MKLTVCTYIRYQPTTYTPTACPKAGWEKERERVRDRSCWRCLSPHASLVNAWSTQYGSISKQRPWHVFCFKDNKQTGPSAEWISRFRDWLWLLPNPLGQTLWKKEEEEKNFFLMIYTTFSLANVTAFKSTLLWALAIFQNSNCLEARLFHFFTAPRYLGGQVRTTWLVICQPWPIYLLLLGSGLSVKKNILCTWSFMVILHIKHDGGSAVVAAAAAVKFESLAKIDATMSIAALAKPPFC